MGQRIIFDHPHGATPLEDEELEGLKIPSITTRGELDQYEQLGIAEADSWAFGRRRSDILTYRFAMRLHEKMFGSVWSWAGMRRKTEKNIGVDPNTIDTELQKLLDDVRYQIAENIYQWDERAAWFHHRLTSIHPFPNGNGRHARLYTDLLLWTHTIERFTWGSNRSAPPKEVRKSYIHALREADDGNIKLLLDFVRS